MQTEIPKSSMIKIMKGMRVKLDEHFSNLKELTPSREISIAITSAQNAKMWLGNVLKSLNLENPDPNSKNATNTEIAPTADTYDGKLGIGDLDHIRKVKIMRKRLSDVYEDIETLEEDNSLSNSLTEIGFRSVTKAWEYMVESDMWLGNELGRIRDENNK